MNNQSWEQTTDVTTHSNNCVPCFVDFQGTEGLLFLMAVQPAACSIALLCGHYLVAANVQQITDFLVIFQKCLFSFLETHKIIIMIIIIIMFSL